MTPTTTAILGGGFGGAATALALRAALPPAHRIAVIDRDENFTVGAGNCWVMTGKAGVEDIRAPRSRLREKGVDVMRADVTAIDPTRRIVSTSQGDLPADFLVVALGAELHLAAVPGLSAAHSFYSADDAARLKAALAQLKAGEVVVLIPRTPFKCPPAPYEGALAIAEHFKARGLRDAVNISVYTVEPAPMPSAGPRMGEFLRGHLQRAGIAFHPLRRTSRVDGAAKRIDFDDGGAASFDLLVAVPPHQAPKVVRDAGLAPESGWVGVDAATLKTPHDRVWAIGDVTSVPVPGRFKPDAPLLLPKAGVLAERQGQVVAAQIAALADGRGGPLTPFDGQGECFIELGDGMAVRGVGQFFALPHPAVLPASEPSAEELKAKRAWVRRRLAFDFS